jgi:DNA polymerase-3 subunit epsilon
MKICALDTETTGLNVEKDRVTEWGIVLYDVAARQPVRISGFLMKSDIFISSEIEQLTGITNEMLSTYGVEPGPALRAVNQLAAQADLFLAHNAPFDRGFYEAECKRQKVEICKKPWADSRTDLPPEAYKKGKSASLKYLCCDHSIYYQAHRAVSDVLAMLQLLGQYDIDAVVKRSQIPNVEVRAVVSYDDRLLAKERGYYWKSELKQWRRPMKLDEVDAEKQSAPFPVILCEEK